MASHTVSWIGHSLQFIHIKANNGRDEHSKCKYGGGNSTKNIGRNALAIMNRQFLRCGDFSVINVSWNGVPGHAPYYLFYYFDFLNLNFANHPLYSKIAYPLKRKKNLIHLFVIIAI